MQLELQRDGRVDTEGATLERHHRRHTDVPLDTRGCRLNVVTLDHDGLEAYFSVLPFSQARMPSVIHAGASAPFR